MGSERCVELVLCFPRTVTLRGTDSEAALVAVVGLRRAVVGLHH